MKALKASGNVTIIAILVVVAVAIAFWVLLLGPKRDEVAKLDAEIAKVQGSLSVHRAEVATGEEARARFPVNYQQLVLLGKAVPGDDDTASLLVQLNRIAQDAGVSFRDIELSAGGASEESSSAASIGAPVSATEAAASLLPLGASIGTAGLAVMPYTLTFDGTWFQLADFIKGLDSLVDTQEQKIAVDGRLLTLDGFSLVPDSTSGFPDLEATFAVTTYLTPPDQGVTAGATPVSPAGASAAPAAATTGAAP